MTHAVAMALAIALTAIASSANALCSYNGVDNAKTTVQREFRDSKWVVRAKVVSAKDHFSDMGGSWTSYDLVVEHAFKGKPARRLRFFTERDSGGFYMDRPGNLPAAHDIGGRYLLFLNPLHPSADEPAHAKGAVFVNYSCGRSGPWSRVTSDDLKALTALE